jgi:hypothetical protein
VARTCRLKNALGELEACTAQCAFWEPGGAVLAGRCAFENLDLGGRSDVAADLLALRRRLEQLGERDDRELRALFHRLLNTDDE